MAKGQKPPDLPPAPAITKDDAAVQAESAAERARLRGRKGRQGTILTRGVLTGPEAEGATTLLGGDR